MIIVFDIIPITVFDEGLTNPFDDVVMYVYITKCTTALILFMAHH